MTFLNNLWDNLTILNIMGSRQFYHFEYQGIQTTIPFWTSGDPNNLTILNIMGPRLSYHSECHEFQTTLLFWISGDLDHLTILNIRGSRPSYHSEYQGPRQPYHSEYHGVQTILPFWISGTQTTLPFWISCTAWDPDDCWRCRLWWCECRRWQHWYSRLSWLMCSNLNRNAEQSQWRPTASWPTPVGSGR